MPNLELRFSGYARVYLEGREALEVSEKPSNQQMNYFIGTPESELRVCDYRRVPAAAAQKALAGIEEFAFAEFFCQSAWVEIFADADSAEIVMREGEHDGKLPTLWLGVIENDRMPAHTISWELLKPLPDERTAFAALVP